MWLFALLACPAPVDLETVACGPELRCEAGDVCVQTQEPAECTNKADSAEPCPEGTEETMCGGAGIPCCCAPAPAATWQCWSGCGEEPSCECAAEACSAGTDCVTTDDGFLCEELPKP